MTGEQFEIQLLEVLRGIEAGLYVLGIVGVLSMIFKNMGCDNTLLREISNRINELISVIRSKTMK